MAAYWKITEETGAASHLFFAATISRATFLKIFQSSFRSNRDADIALAGGNAG